MLELKPRLSKVVEVLFATDELVCVNWDFITRNTVAKLLDRMLGWEGRGLFLLLFCCLLCLIHGRNEGEAVPWRVSLAPTRNLLLFQNSTTKVIS